MPVMDGTAVARAIRALPRPDAKAIPILAMSANAFSDDIRQSLAAGMNEHLSKPIEEGKLLAAMARLLGKDEKSRPLNPSDMPKTSRSIFATCFVFASINSVNKIYTLSVISA